MVHASGIPVFVSQVRPDDPFFCFRPERLKRAATWFRDSFPGEVFYAVKANPALHILDGLWDAGIRGFDVASPAEIELVATRFPGAKLAYMHPVKNRNAIARAYHEFGVRRFVLDSQAELQKILDATGHAKDLILVVRVGVSNAGAAVPLTGKFGVSEAEAPALLRETRRAACRLGVSFHVGSQSLNPNAWPSAMTNISRLIRKAAVTVDIVDVGGGFPSLYKTDGGMPALINYAASVDAAFEEMMVLESAELWSEPGRALVAEAESLLVRVDGVKGDALYINDGGFGALYDAVNLGWEFPLRALSPDRALSAGERAFTLYGPTCDSADKLAQKVMLPANIGEGDYIEFGNIGAYGRSMATGFNGFGQYGLVETEDAPFASAYVPEDWAVPAVSTGIATLAVSANP
ncbi:MAG: type III PLP-dependent enzyme [Hyphomonadaceae bacterium]|nr:type III PLP-dependent enzyme [Hyphomonadaceae bacterium]